MRKDLDLSTLSGGKHLAAALEIHARMRRDYALLLDEIAELEHAQTAIYAGYSTLPALLAQVLRITGPEARRMVTQSELVAETVTPTGYTAPAKLPTVRTALHDGLIDAKHVDAVATVMEKLPDWAKLEHRELVETTLAETARVSTPLVVTEHGHRLLEHLKTEETNPHLDREQAEPRNTFRYSRLHGRGIKFAGQVEAETADVLEAMLGPLAKPEKNDTRTLPERQGDALCDILHLAAKSDGLPKQGGQRPHMNITLDLNVLTDAVGTATLDGGTPLCASAARRLACDAHLVPMVLNGESVPLDVGRTRRLVKPGQRKALVARDKGCAFPDCHRAARWCDAHHVKHWIDGGPTDLANLIPR